MTEPLKKEERVTISLILNQIVQQQQQHVLWISNVASGLESIRTEIRRTDENHARELDRLHDIIKTLLPQNQLGVCPTPKEVYNQCADASAFFGNNAAPASVNDGLRQPIATMGTASQQAKISLPVMPYSKTEPTQFDPKDDVSSDSSDGEPWEIPDKSENKDNVSTIAEEPNSLATKYIKKEDDWECNTCYTFNPMTVKECLCCQGSNKPNSDEKQKGILASSIMPLTTPLPSKFSFGLHAGKPVSPKLTVSPGEKPKVSFADAAKETAEKNPSPRFNRPSTNPSNFSFGSKAISTSSIFGGNKSEIKPFSFKAETTSSIDNAQPTGHSGVKSLFGTSVNKSLDDSQSSATPTKIFGSNSSTGGLSLDKLNLSGVSLFNEDAKKQAQNELAKQKSSKFGASVFNQEADDDRDSAEEYEPTAEFTPVCPLPDLVEVVTGEEGETVLYKDRCKLYRYAKDTKEWKERGIGNIKVLLDEATGKARCVMRRDQTLKVACNFQLSSGMNVSKMPKNGKAVMWLCLDFSEGQNTEKFSARFATAEQADEFAKHFAENCK